MSGKKISSPIEFEFLADEYFDKCIAEKRAFTFSGFAHHMGFTHASSLLKYRKEDGYEGYHDIANQSALRIEAYTEEQLYNKGVNVAGPIFALKSRLGLSDKKEGEGDQIHIKIEGLAAKI